MLITDDPFSTSGGRVDCDMAPGGSRRQPGAGLTDVVVLVPADRTRAWSFRLADLIRARSGLPTELRRVPGLRSQKGIPSERFEARLFGPSAHGHSAWTETAAASSAECVSDWTRRLVVNATGCDPELLPEGIRLATVVSPIFEARFDVEALAVPLARKDPPYLGVVASNAGGRQTLYGARLCVSDQLWHTALDAILGRALTMLAGAVEHVINGGPLAAAEPPPQPARTPAPLEVWARRLSGAYLPKLGRRLRKPFVREGWSIGVRRLKIEGPPSELDLSPATFEVLHNPPDHFYADPFLLTHEGRTALFFEDYDFRLGRAQISTALIDEQGQASAPSDALQRPYHLSYPFVFTHDGAALMAPETSANRTIELYEAQAFPHQWRLRTVLIDQIDASDTTLHHDEATGLWWMFSAVSEFGSSSHDSLSLFFSDGLDGPWRPHPGNPVKLDPASSRPAGPLVRWDGRLFRPAQDCTRAYGDALVWCEIKRLDPYGFHEEKGVGRSLNGRRVHPHTYGRAAGLEVVDFKTSRWRFQP